MNVHLFQTMPVIFIYYEPTNESHMQKHNTLENNGRSKVFFYHPFFPLSPRVSKDFDDHSQTGNGQCELWICKTTVSL